jgi:hypothetical protein
MMLLPSGGIGYLESLIKYDVLRVSQLVGSREVCEVTFVVGVKSDEEPPDTTFSLFPLLLFFITHFLAIVEQPINRKLASKVFLPVNR